jgi:hypothetical protein
VLSLIDFVEMFLRSLRSEFRKMFYRLTLSGTGARANVFTSLPTGFGINLDYFSLQPNIVETFSGGLETQGDKRNPVSFRFRT